MKRLLKKIFNKGLHLKYKPIEKSDARFTEYDLDEKINNDQMQIDNIYQSL